MMPKAGGLDNQDEQFMYDLNTWLHEQAVARWNRDHPEDPVGDYLFPEGIGIDFTDFG